MRLKSLILTLVLLAVPATCLAGEKLNVFVSILPQQYFLEKIGGDLVDISVMVRPGASPATYEPTPKQMEKLSAAKAYFSIGVPFEAAWLERIRAANPKMMLVETDHGIAKIPMAAHNHHDDHHGGHEEHGDEHKEHGHAEKHHHEHDHGAHSGEILDPHIWLSTKLAAQIAQNIADGLAKLDPSNAATYQTNLKAFQKELLGLNHQIKSILDPIPPKKRVFMVFHPSWGYFAKEYGLTQIPIESQGKEPGPKALQMIIEEGREQGIGVVFVQPQFSQKSAKVIASELGAQVVPLDPLAEQWSENLIKAAKAFTKSLK